jgi:hypothetical protein
LSSRLDDDSILIFLPNKNPIPIPIKIEQLGKFTVKTEVGADRQIFVKTEPGMSIKMKFEHINIKSEIKQERGRGGTIRCSNCLQTGHTTSFCVNPRYGSNLIKQGSMENKFATKLKENSNSKADKQKERTSKSITK